MEFQLGQDWQLSPLKGDTGKAYVGLKNNAKVLVRLSGRTSKLLLISLLHPYFHASRNENSA